MSKNWDVCDQLNYQFVPVPRALARGFKDLSINAKWAYSLMLDRMMMSRQNIDRFHDKNGMFLLFNQDELAELIGASKRTVIRIFKELEESGLIETKKQGFGKAQKIYLRKLSELSEIDSETSPKKSCQNGTTRSDKLASREVPNCHYEKCQNGTTRNAKLSPQEVTPVSPQDMPNLSPPTKSNTYKSNTYMSKKSSCSSSRSNIAVNGSVGNTTPTPTQSNFGTSVVTPTLEKIQAFVKKNNFTFSPEKFFDYYNAVGWKMRGMPITDWQSLCRSWQARERPTETKREEYQIKNFTDLTDEELGAIKRKQEEKDGRARKSYFGRADEDLPF